MSKYEPLQRHLETARLAHLPMTFDEVEAILGFALPPSSRRHRAWWSNNPSNSVITHAWLTAGYRTEQVDLERRRLVFRKQHPAADPDAATAVGRHPIFGCMKGTVTMVPDFDPTAPADPEWGALAFGEKA